MATFNDHILQAKKNIVFLSDINQKVPDSLDWQVTTCFYTALHLINAHLAKFNMQYRRHVDVKDALNPERPTSITKLDEDEYVSYIALQSLSRRARYLVEDTDITSERAYLTYEKHLAKSLRHLDKLIVYFSRKYDLEIPKFNITCSSIKFEELTFVKKV